MRVTVRVNWGKKRRDFVLHLGKHEQTTDDVELKLAQRLSSESLDMNGVTDWRITRIEGGTLD